MFPTVCSWKDNEEGCYDSATRHVCEKGGTAAQDDEQGHSSISEVSLKRVRRSLAMRLLWHTEAIGTGRKDALDVHDIG